jgi:hypothetical protein
LLLDHLRVWSWHMRISYRVACNRELEVLLGAC